jgi:quercetin dioxygenase-like cupin family protein
MNKHQTRRLIVLAVSSTYLAVGQTAGKPGEDGKPHHVVVPLTTWNPGGVVSGDPNKPGAAFVIRIAHQANQVIVPHWHPEDEHIVVVKGTWYLGSGEVFDRNPTREMNVGDYALMPKKMAHFGWSKTDSIIQVHGIGPFKVIPVDEWQFVTGWKWMPDASLKPEPGVVSAFKWKPKDRVRSKRGAGVVLFGARSVRNKVAQYEIQGDNGAKFFEFEDELSAVPPSKTSISGALAGTWACVSRGTPQGDLNSTLSVRQDNQTTTGVMSWPNGGTAFASSASKPDALEIRLDPALGNILLRAEYREGQLVGEWSTRCGQKGSWGCSRKTP